jgi:hypothetical protein
MCDVCSNNEYCKNKRNLIYTLPGYIRALAVALLDLRDWWSGLTLIEQRREAQRRILVEGVERVISAQYHVFLQDSFEQQHESGDSDVPNSTRGSATAAAPSLLQKTPSTRGISVSTGPSSPGKKPRRMSLAAPSQSVRRTSLAFAATS